MNDDEKNTKYCALCGIKLHEANTKEQHKKLCDSCIYEDSDGDMYEDFDA